MHTGIYAIVRVRPAYAGEGRYFVRVRPGTNAETFDYQVPEPISYQDLTADPEVDHEIEAIKLDLFSSYLEAQEKLGFEGSFFDFLNFVDVKDKARIVSAHGVDAIRQEWDFGEPEEIQAMTEEEEEGLAITAHVYSVADSEHLFQRLEDGQGGSLLGMQSLLSALEACGVDNARIEIEGGDELPIMDGSSLGWMLNIQFAGLRPAPLQEDSEPLPRLALRPPQPIVVRGEDGSFIQLVPEDTTRLTVGIDHTDMAEIIGKQWLSWSPFEDQHYRFDVAPARQYFESPEQVVALREQGYLLGGTDGCAMVAFGDRWWDSQLVRLEDDESVRHAMQDLIGDLSLNSFAGHSGLPIGHVIAYKPNHDLAAAFVRALRESTEDDDWIPLMLLAGLKEEGGAPKA